MRSVFHFPWIILARYHVHTCCRPSCRGSWQICKADVHGFGNWSGLLSARPMLRSGNTFIALCKIPKRVLFNGFEIVILQPGLVAPSTFLVSHWILICAVGWAVLAILSSTGSLEQESGCWGALRKHIGDEIKAVQLNMVLGLAFPSDFAVLKLMMCRSLPSKISFLLFSLSLFPTSSSTLWRQPHSTGKFFARCRPLHIYIPPDCSATGRRFLSDVNMGKHWYFSIARAWLPAVAVSVLGGVAGAGHRLQQPCCGTEQSREGIFREASWRKAKSVDTVSFHCCLWPLDGDGYKDQDISWAFSSMWGIIQPKH